MSKFGSCLLLALGVAGLAGCSNIPASPPNFANSMKSYDTTMTAEQKQAAISDLQNSGAKSRQAAGQDGSTSSVKPAQN